MADGAAGRAGAALFVLPLVALCTGHMLSNAVRTLPALAGDVMARDLAMTPAALAGLLGAFHLAFAAGQIPAGVALDRFGVRPVALALIATVMAGAALAAAATGPLSVLLAQVVLGLGCSGMLICPMTFAARALSPGRFGLWSGVVQTVGNSGMLLSASPLALLVESAGWRAGFLAAVGFGALAAALVIGVVREPPVAAPPAGRSIWVDAAEVLRLLVSRPLRGVVTLAFASFAAQIGVRGLWGGPWLMEAKGLSRLAAGNLLLGFTVVMTLAPALAGVLDRRFPGRRRALLAGGHLLAAAALVLLVAGGPGGALSRLTGVPQLPQAWDLLMLSLFALTLSTQVLCFAVTRALVPAEQTGKALSALNVSFFVGTAVIQGASGPAAALGGVDAGLLTFAVALVVCSGAFLLLSRARRGGEP